MNKSKKNLLLALSLAGTMALSGVAMAAPENSPAAQKDAGYSQSGTAPCDQMGEKNKGQMSQHGLKLMSFLNMNPQAFQEQCQQGKTLLQIAQGQGKTEAELHEFLVKEMNDHITNNVKNGKWTEAQAGKERLQVEERVSRIMNETPMHPQKMHGPSLESSKAAQETLGLDEVALKKELDAGKTLAQIATERNVSVDTLKTNMQSEITAHLDQEVKAGNLTQEKAAAFKAQLPEMVDKMINGQMAPHEPMHQKQKQHMHHQGEKQGKAPAQQQAS